MLTRLLSTSRVLLVFCLTSTPALAQYMFIDTNGDGVHTAADVFQPVGPTQIDVWICTDQNRDGSPAVCGSGNEPMSINSYEFALRTSGGTVAWGAFTNLRPEFTVWFARYVQATPTEYYNGFGGYPAIQPGKYILGTLSAEVATGTPSLSFIPFAIETNPASGTSFGSACPGLDSDNTLKVGSDWFDADGIPWGGSSSPPVLDQPSDMTLGEGQVADQTLQASDPDGSLITFLLASGPSYAQVTALRSDLGHATGTLHLAPRYGDAGTQLVTVQASDGALTAERTLNVTVQHVNRAPFVTGGGGFCLAPGDIRLAAFSGSDPDGDHLSFTQTGLPPFADFVDNGDNSAVLFVHPPSSMPTGTWDATVTATDDQSAVSRLVRFTVSDSCYGGGVSFGGESGHKPVAHSGGPYQGFAGDPLSFQGSESSDADGDRLTLAWAFGDGATAMGTTALHTYSTAGEYLVRLLVSDATHAVLDSTTAVVAAVPTAWVLHQNRPNPFNPATQISFDLPQASQVDIRVFNAVGRLVRKIVSASLAKGTHVVEWDGRDDRGASVASGVYFCELRAGSHVDRRQMVLLR
jgi:hypothetical protein